MGRSFNHLTYNDRLIIERMLIKGHHKQVIADTIGCSLATIYNEIKRATYTYDDGRSPLKERYNPEAAHKKYRDNMKAKGVSPKILSAPHLVEALRSYIVGRDYSPMAALYAIKNSGKEYETTICVNTLYKAIERGYIEGVTMENLPMRGRKKQRKRKVAKRATKGVSIEKRPKEVETREIFGHWEMDTVVSGGKGKAALLVLTERKTRFEIIEPMRDHTVDETIRALNRIERDMGSIFYSVFKTITVDNGTEFGNPKAIAKALRKKGNRTELFYCHPYMPHERGSNENNNKFIRRKIPKSQNLDKEKLTRKDCYYLAEWINGYPRRIFGGDTARKRYNMELDALEFP